MLVITSVHPGAGMAQRRAIMLRMRPGAEYRLSHLATSERVNWREALRCAVSGCNRGATGSFRVNYNNQSYTLENAKRAGLVDALGDGLVNQSDRDVEIVFFEPGEVQPLQKTLRQQGSYLGNLDGIIGPRTTSAIKFEKTDDCSLVACILEYLLPDDQN
jgi:hypothetical protein